MLPNKNSGPWYRTFVFHSSSEKRTNLRSPILRPQLKLIQIHWSQWEKLQQRIRHPSPFINLVKVSTYAFNYRLWWHIHSNLRFTVYLTYGNVACTLSTWIAAFYAHELNVRGKVTSPTQKHVKVIELHFVPTGNWKYSLSRNFGPSVAKQRNGWEFEIVYATLTTCIMSLAARISWIESNDWIEQATWIS